MVVATEAPAMKIAAQRLLPVRLRVPDVSKTRWRRALLGGGVAATALYFVMDAVASRLYDGYSYRDQTISELSAIGASTRPLWIPGGVAYAVLTIAFAAGIWTSAGERRALRVVAAVVGAYAVVGLVGWPFAPMHQREVLAVGGGTFSDTMHLVFSGVDGILVILMLASASAAFGGRFRMYTLATLAVVLVFGPLVGLDADKVQDNEATPWLGVKERILVFAPMVWMTALAVVLMREGRPK
jgi:hypothetical protein